jgi:hypothetical protein
MLHESIDRVAVTAQDLLILSAARCWRDAVDGGQPTMPALHALLGPTGHDMLGPVIDSVMHLCEVHFDRRLCAGCPLHPAYDGVLLCKLINDPALLDHFETCHSSAVRAAFFNALCAMKVMLALN